MYNKNILQFVVLYLSHWELILASPTNNLIGGILYLSHWELILLKR